MHLSRAALIVHRGCDKYSGEEENLGPASTSSFGLCGKAERSAGAWQHRGACLAALHRHLPVAVWWEPWSVEHLASC